MEKIASFTVNHLTLKRGIYVSRRDITPSGDVLTTFDVRMTEPNRQYALHPKSLHAIEHLVATFLRNDPEWRDKVVYWGPMGCCTGNYLILQGALRSVDIVDLMKRTFEFVAEYTGEIPGATPRDCGNYTFMDLSDAKKQARKFLDEVLHVIKEDQMSYPED
ncbi:MAG: S-ribosylhomocysteine lyase [Muribaculum sp.]|nr:S-ribosylhomocysteine lyase [Muribaculum sp.]